MKISAIVNEVEKDFRVINKAGNHWICVLDEDPNDPTTIIFTYERGIISNLKVHEDIDTESGIILERLLNTLRAFYETQQMGFELEDEQETNDFLTKPYDPEEIRVRAVVFSAFQVNMDIKKGKIDLNTDFQRNFVWNDAQKSLLIESMLLKIPLPAFYFAEDKKGRYQVVDGLQRLTVISQFLNNEFKLKKLQYLHHLEGLYFSVDPSKRIGPEKALYEPYDSRVEGTMLNINIIEASSPLSVKYDIFYRINTGGRPLNRQEIRNCFASERIRKLLKRMSSDQRFKSATGYSVNDTRMDAQELALRFSGFFFYSDLYVGNMNGFLDEVLDRLNEVSDQQLSLVEEKYYTSLVNAHHLFGGYAFRKVLPEHLRPNARRQFLNKAMFITWTNILCHYETFQISRVPEGGLTAVLAHHMSANIDLLNSLTTGTTDRNKLDFVAIQFAWILQEYLDHHETT